MWKIAVALMLSTTGCLTTKSDRQTLYPIVKSIRARPGGLEVVRCSIQRIKEERTDFCITPVLGVFLGGHGGSGYSYTNDYLEETQCWTSFVWTGGA